MRTFTCFGGFTVQRTWGLALAVQIARATEAAASRSRTANASERIGDRNRFRTRAVKVASLVMGPRRLVSDRDGIRALHSGARAPLRGPGRSRGHRARAADARGGPRGRLRRLRLQVRVVRRASFPRGVFA